MPLYPLPHAQLWDPHLIHCHTSPPTCHTHHLVKFQLTKHFFFYSSIFFILRSHEVPKFHYWCWQTITGFTGVLLVLVCALMYTFAIQYARRKVFNLFWFTHNLYVIYYALMIFHGSGRLVQPPFMWYFFLGPAILFTLDKLVSISRKKAEISVLKAELLPSGKLFSSIKFDGKSMWYIVFLKGVTCMFTYTWDYPQCFAK